MQYAWIVLLGLAIGAVSGLAGIGGGILLIPALALLCGMNQHQAVGTTLWAMVPPVTLAAGIEYYRRGHVDLKLAAILAVTIAFGSWATAHFAQYVPDVWLRRIFGAVLLVVSLRFLAR